MPGEDKDSNPALQPGGLEQIMRCTGELDLRGERYEIDCVEARDRSWNQLRAERPLPVPPVAWTPAYFGEDLAFNQVGYEPLDTDPAWAGLYQVPQDKPAFHFGWVLVDGEPRELTSVRRTALEYHPRLHTATRHELELTDERGDTHRFEGESICAAAVPAWPNMHPTIGVARWTDERGRETYGTFQEVWFGDYQRAMKQRMLEGSAATAR